MKHYEMVINGSFVSSAKSTGVINPATGEIFAQVYESTFKQVDLAVEAARAAFPSWSQLPDNERKNYCHQLAQLIEGSLPELMTLITQETGKPLKGLEGIGSSMEIGASIAWTHFTADIELSVDVMKDDEDVLIEEHRKPLGVVASMTPWNWPLMIAIWHIIPALRTGNTVVIKPSEYAPLAISRFVQLANLILPSGVLNIINGDATVGNRLITHSDVNKIVFTGSTATGKRIMESAATSMKQVMLELDGNDVGIILPDADIGTILPKVFAASFHNNGQACAAIKRLYVHESQYEDVCFILGNMAKTVRVGDGLEEEVDLGPIQNEKQFKLICQLVQSVRAGGGRLIAGGHPINRSGYFFEPTIVADLTDSDKLVDEDSFGPILPVIKYSDIEEVINRANQNDTGLGSSIWSNDVKNAQKYARQLECGEVWINTHGSIHANSLFGGIKQSGLRGAFGAYGLEEFTSIQTINVAKY